MKPVRPLLLGLAAGLLPCCLPPADDVGDGDRIAQVTVRASITIDDIQPNDHCERPTLSSDGLVVIFDSASNSMTPNDGNGYSDLFLRRRSDGGVQNLTLFNFPPEEYPEVGPHDCLSPALSANGRYVAFISRGDYGGLGPDPAFGLPTAPLAVGVVWRLDLRTGEIRRGFKSLNAPNQWMSDPCISADGRYIAFATGATNMSVTLPAFTPQQIFVTDLVSDTMTLVSRSTGNSATPANASCNDPAMSEDGQKIVWHSAADNLHPDWAGGGRTLIYQGTPAGAACQIVSRAPTVGFPIANAHSSFATISGDGNWIAFNTDADNMAGVAPPYLVRRNLNTGAVDLVTDQPGQINFAIFPNGYVPSMSRDGAMVSFLSRSDTLAGVALDGFVNVFVREMPGGTILHVSRHLDGRPSNFECGPPVISADGRWIAWDTESPNMVDGDTNGVDDVFLRGPLR